MIIESNVWHLVTKHHSGDALILMWQQGTGMAKPKGSGVQQEWLSWLRAPREGMQALRTFSDHFLTYTPDSRNRCCLWKGSPVCETVLSTEYTF